MRNLAMLFPYLVTENLPVARLGTRAVNPAFDAPVPRPVAEPFTERYPWLLPGVVALAALLVGLFLASLIRQVRGRLRPPGRRSFPHANQTGTTVGTRTQAI